MAHFGAMLLPRPLSGTAAVVASLGVAVLTGCGEAGPLDGVGGVSQEWVNEVRSPSTTVVVEVVVGREGLVYTSDVRWLNDDLAEQASGTPDDVLAGVWERYAGSRFVQASRSEIAAALPTIEFPTVVPKDVTWLTSQLVYEDDSPVLDPDTSAAFGLWRVTPYTIDEGRLAVLTVGVAPTQVALSRSDVVPIVVPGGIALGWTSAGLRYDLLCRSGLTEDLCMDVAESFVLLSTTLP